MYDRVRPLGVPPVTQEWTAEREVCSSSPASAATVRISLARASYVQPASAMASASAVLGLRLSVNSHSLRRS